MLDVLPVQPEHLDEVTTLLLTHVSPELDRDRARFKDYIRAHYLDGPPDGRHLPSLVAVDADGAVAGFCGLTTSMMRWRGRPVLLAASGPLVAGTSHRAKAPGLFLTKAVLSGGQDLSITDGANDDATALWRRFGAETVAQPSMRWIRPLNPSGLALSLAAARIPLMDRLSRGTTLLDRVVGRPLRPAPVSTADEALTPDVLAKLVADLEGAPEFALRPDYDIDGLAWRFRELERVTVKGSLVARVVVDAEGRRIGWFVYHHLPQGLGRVMQIGCRQVDADAVVAHLLDHAARSGSGALFGRYEAHYADALRDQPVIVPRSAPRVLVHSEDPELRLDVHAGRSLLTRLEGEAWNGLHHQPMA